MSRQHRIALQIDKYRFHCCELMNLYFDTIHRVVYEEVYVCLPLIATDYGFIDSAREQ